MICFHKVKCKWKYLQGLNSSSIPLRQGHQTCGFSQKRSDQKFKVLFFGTDDFSVPTLEALHSNRNSSDGVVGELEVCCLHMKHLVCKVKQFANEKSLNVNFYPQTIQEGQYDIGVVSSFGKLLSKKLISSFPQGVINVHGSILPRWRGASPIAHAILAGDKETGISIMEIEPHHFDIGKVLAQKTMEIPFDISRRDLTRKMAVMGSELLIEVLQDLDSHRRNAVPQDDAMATYAPVIKPFMLEVDFNESSSLQVWNQYRALCDFGKLFSTWKDSGGLTRFDEMTNPKSLEHLNLDVRFPEASPGQTFYVKNKKTKEKRIVIRCREGFASFEKFFYDKRKVMNALDFYNGFLSKYRNQDKKLLFTRSK